MRKFDTIINKTYKALPSQLLNEANADATVSGFLRNITQSFSKGNQAFITPNYKRENRYVLLGGDKNLPKLQKIIQDLKPPIFDPNQLKNEDIVRIRSNVIPYMVEAISATTPYITLRQCDKNMNPLPVSSSTSITSKKTNILGYYNQSDPKKQLPTNPDTQSQSFMDDGKLKDEQALGEEIFQAINTSAQYSYQTKELPSFTIDELISKRFYGKQGYNRREFSKQTIPPNVAHQTVMNFINQHLKNIVSYMKPEQLAQASKGGLGKRFLQALDTGVAKGAQAIGRSAKELGGVLLNQPRVEL